MYSVAWRRCLLFGLRANDSFGNTVNLGGLCRSPRRGFQMCIQIHSLWSQPAAVRSGQKASTCVKLRMFLGAGARFIAAGLIFRC